MKLPHRRQFLHLAAGAAALPAVSRIAWAQAYPTRPVRIVAAFPAGGSVDLHARLMGQWLSERLGQQFIVENRSGAGGNIGTEAVVRAQPDGYTLLLAATPNCTNRGRETMRIFALLMLGLALQLATSAQAQNATKPANEFLITLGTAGGPVPRFERAGISTLIQVNGESYLFDAGAGMTRQLAGAKVSLLDIQKIFLTHLHDDHYSGLGDFAGQLAALKPEKTIDIYGPGLTKSVVEGLHAFMYANRLIRETERKFPQRIDIYVAHEIKPGEVYKDENIRVTAIENHHFHFPNGSPPDGKTTSLSYRIETPNRVIVITGDTGAFEGLATFASGADLFVTEVIDPEDAMNMLQSLMKEKMSKETYERRKFHMEEEHMTPESIAKLATEAKVKSVVLTHLPPGLKGENAYEEWAKKIRAGFPGEVFAAKDLDRY